MNRRYLDVRYDITSLTPDQIGNLALEAVAQAEASDTHPGVNVESEDLWVEDDSRTILVHINVSLPQDSTHTPDQLRREVADCLSVGLDNDFASDDTPALAASLAWSVESAEEV